MARRISYSFVLCSFLLLFIMIPTGSVLACTPGEIPPIVLEDIQDRSYFVKGMVIEVDDGGFNAILRVDHYVVGRGPAQLLIYRNDPVLSVVYRERNYDTGCLYGGTTEPWTVGETGYFSLTRLRNGSYSVTNGYGQDYYFTADQGMVYFLRDDPESDDPFMFSVEQLQADEFEALVMELNSSTETSLPDRSQGEPRRHLLYVTTQSGTDYLLPVDGTDAVMLEPCTENCRITSPDGSHYAQSVDSTHLEFFYHYGLSQREDGVNLPVEVEGQAVLFSADSDFVLVWNEAVLSLYRITPTPEDSNGNILMYGLGLRLDELATLALQTSSTVQAEQLHGYATWSTDSTTFAYGDAEGLWHFDFFEQTEPELILPLQEGAIPPVLELSRSGRYLRYGDADEWVLLDVQTGKTYDDGVISPDEVHLALLDPEAFERPTSEAPGAGIQCLTPLRQNCALVVRAQDVKIVEHVWTQDDTMFIAFCQTADRHICQTTTRDDRFDREVILSSRNLEHFTYPILDATYEPHDKILSLLTGDYELQLGGVQDRFEVTGLDSPIESIEWGPTLWYDAP